jgi:hypothetical protein
MLDNHADQTYRAKALKDLPCGHADTEPELLITDNTLRSKVPRPTYWVITIR